MDIAMQYNGMRNRLTGWDTNFKGQVCGPPPSLGDAVNIDRIMAVDMIVNCIGIIPRFGFLQTNGTGEIDQPTCPASEVLASIANQV